MRYFISVLLILANVAVCAAAPYTTIQLRRDTPTNWTAYNPVLAQGEVGCELAGAPLRCTAQKVGDGITAWSALPYTSQAKMVGVGPDVQTALDGKADLTNASQVITAGDVVTKGPYADVRAFGAHAASEVGYSSFDNTAAIQAAIDYVSSGGTVYIPKGTYLFTGITVPSYVEIRGAGLGATVLKLLPGSNNHAISLASGTSQMTYLHDFSIDGSKSTQTVATDGIHYENTFDNPTMLAASARSELDARHQIRNVYIRNMKGNGVYLAGRGESQLSNIEVIECDIHSFFLAAYDLWAYNLSSGTSGLQGFWLDPNHDNMKLVGCKSWMSGRIDTSQGDGFWLASSRATLTGCEAQDNAKYGFTVISDGNIITGAIAEANGWYNAYRKSDSAGFYISSTGNYISATAGDRFAGSDPRQQFAFTINGARRNIINIVARNMGTGFANGYSKYNPDFNIVTGTNFKLNGTEEKYTGQDGYSTYSDTDNATVMQLRKYDAAGTSETKSVWDFQINHTANTMTAYPETAGGVFILPTPLQFNGVAANSAPNNSIFRDSSDNVIKIKDNNGVVHLLY